VLQRFKSPAHALQFLAPFGPSATTSAPATITSPHPTTTRSRGRASLPGARSRASPRR